MQTLLSWLQLSGNVEVLFLRVGEGRWEVKKRQQNLTCGTGLRLTSADKSSFRGVSSAIAAGDDESGVIKGELHRFLSSRLGCTSSRE